MLRPAHRPPWRRPGPRQLMSGTARLVLRPRLLPRLASRRMRRRRRRAIGRTIWIVLGILAFIVLFCCVASIVLVAVSSNDSAFQDQVSLFAQARR